MLATVVFLPVERAGDKQVVQSNLRLKDTGASLDLKWVYLALSFYGDCGDFNLCAADQTRNLYSGPRRLGVR